MMTKAWVWAAALLLALAGPLAAQCRGTNLIEQMSAEQRAALDAAIALHPYPEGNLWRAEKPGSRIDVIGTLHVYDPRVDALMAEAGPLIDSAELLLVEAGPEEVAALQKAAASQPDLLFRPDGPTLPEQLTKQEWQALSEEMRKRGIPPVLASKFQPWYVSMLLSIPVCAASQLAEGPKGLDEQLMQRAAAAGIPVKALEPYDTAFRAFAALGDMDQVEVLRTALAMAQGADDQFTTLLDSYFAGKHRQIWEFTRMQASSLPGIDPAAGAADFARMEEVLLTGRTVPWMDVLLPAAEGRHVAVAVGAAHLSGEYGLLYLLAEQGWTLAPLTP